MAASRRVFLLLTLQSLALAGGHSHSRETETYHVSVGHLFVLRCPTVDTHANVSWSRAGSHNQSLPTGVEVRDGLLWFIPVSMSHNGSYTCEKRDRNSCTTEHKSGLRMTFSVSVSSGGCPDALETISITKGTSSGLPCKQTEILKLNGTRNIRWMKDCHPVERQGEPISVDERGFMRLPAASAKDAGKYTCLIDFSLNGRNYTSARSIHLTLKNELTIFQEPEVVYPQQDVVVVKLGKRVELECQAYLGSIEDHEAFMYWTVDGVFLDEYKELNESQKYFRERGKVYGVNTLSISEVLPHLLNVPIRCHLDSPLVSKTGLLWLQEADHSAFHTTIAVSLAAFLGTLALVAAFLLFKVDMVLAYRKLLRHFTKQQAPDGKLYDAYVSFLRPDTLGSAEMARFALQILPEELERQHGYSLYIRGRDDCPGEAVHDIIASTVLQCRRLIIILSPDTKPCTHDKKEEELLCDSQNHLCYEQKIGLYDALTQKETRVILVEIGGPVDYSCLPESVRYIKRKQGSLKWKKPSLETHKLTQLYSNRNFWKNLRYHMPSVPARGQTII